MPLTRAEDQIGGVVAKTFADRDGLLPITCPPRIAIKMTFAQTLHSDGAEEKFLFDD